MDADRTNAQRGPSSSDAAPSPPYGGRPWHALSPRQVASDLSTSPAGLTAAEAESRIRRFGPNRVDPPPPPRWWSLALRQFASPLIYILVAAALVAIALGEHLDAAFIAAVLLLNALIGYVNEARAQRRVRSLGRLVRTRARVRRDGRTIDVDSERLVPGDLLLLESGGKVPADLRLLESRALRVDEALLTGESVPADKDAETPLPADTPLADRRNMCFAGTMVTSGRGTGLVVATGPGTEVGAIAAQLTEIDAQPPPLILRMRRFAHVVGTTALGVSAILVLIGALRREPLADVFLAAVALAVSAVPEGLPIALTVALAVAVSRMARRGVVVRHLPAVEALGSCGVIATDKTGTLTRNELSVERIVAGDDAYDVTGGGYAPSGELRLAGRPVVLEERPRLFRLVRAAALANEASLVRAPGEALEWEWSGDPTDVALLSLAHKAGCDAETLREAHPQTASIPFEPERRYAASFHVHPDGTLVCVKGAPERVLEMCERGFEPRDGSGGGGENPDRGPALFDGDRVRRQQHELMGQGYRVLAVAERIVGHAPSSAPPREPSRLVFLGLVGMTDPPREGVPAAVARCANAGVHVVMVTGDHARTAAAIASRVGLGPPDQPVLEGPAIAEWSDEELAERLASYRIVARATPADKLRVVRAWQHRDTYVAVTGDGVNDAPALRQANLGVAMGRGGTDVAREAAELVITDDDFASIVAGVEEGRVAYDNVRKVTFLLVSTGAGELLLVLSSTLLGLPIPFTAAQLLWLNLVTNGIQDVALAFEPGEPGVLDRPPRHPRERIFDRVMVERTLLTGLVMGGLGLASWGWWLGHGVPVAEARGLVVQLFVLFEIFHIGNARSERTSAFRLSPLRNPMLLFGTMGALGVHLAAVYSPLFQRILGVQPIGLDEWLPLVALGSVILIVMEAHKGWRRSRRGGLRPTRLSAADRFGAPSAGARGTPGTGRVPASGRSPRADGPARGHREGAEDAAGRPAGKPRAGDDRRAGAGNGE